MEAEAILGALALCESGQLELVGSDTLVFEAEQCPHPVRKRYSFEVLAQAKVVVRADGTIQERARALHSHGIKPLDALHLASAEAANAVFFCTCDDRFLKGARARVKPPTRVVTPLELILEVAP
jgi:predicted nucleic acid-binding protein